jgi:hypothetical protein
LPGRILAVIFMPSFKLQILSACKPFDVTFL